ADGWLLLAMLGASTSYVLGAQLSQQMVPAHVISWVMVGALPLTLPAALWCWPEHAVATPSWWALGYLAVFSTWLGFFAWYAALARDPMRVSQLQLMQPFLSMLLAVPLLGETLDVVTVTAALAVLAVVVLAQG
ncbi:MAG: DMT family transporter, partial [Pseudomonadota bacterium]